jgi:glucose/arabinose dehydrogenase
VYRHHGVALATLSDEPRSGEHQSGTREARAVASQGSRQAMCQTERRAFLPAPPDATARPAKSNGGGQGAHVTGDLAVSPEEVLFVEVGNRGVPIDGHR